MTFGGTDCQFACVAFPIHPHMLRHGCGYALANAGHDTRAIQDWLGHRSNSAHGQVYRVVADALQGFLAQLNRAAPSGRCPARHRVSRVFRKGPHPMSAIGKSRHFSRHFWMSLNDPGCVKTLGGITAPGILGATVMRRAKKRRNLSSARHYDQIRFRFHTANRSGHSGRVSMIVVVA